MVVLLFLILTYNQGTTDNRSYRSARRDHHVPSVGCQLSWCCCYSPHQRLPPRGSPPSAPAVAVAL